MFNKFNLQCIKVVMGLLFLSIGRKIRYFDKKVRWFLFFWLERVHICFWWNILKFGLKYRFPSVARPALEKCRFCLSGGGWSQKVFEPNETYEAQPPLHSPASFFGAAVAREQKHGIFRQPKRFLLTFFR